MNFVQFPIDNVQQTILEDRIILYFIFPNRFPSFPKINHATLTSLNREIRLSVTRE